VILFAMNDEASRRSKCDLRCFGARLAGFTPENYRDRLEHPHLRGYLLSLDWKTNGSCGPAGERGLGFIDSAKQDAAKLAGGFVIQAQVRIFFHHFQGVAEFGHEFRIRLGKHHEPILPGPAPGFIDFLQQLPV
jgi:hypothetical protein